jgi:hypothetical protein
MFAQRPSNPYFGFQRPIQPQVGPQGLPPQLQGQVLQQPQVQPGLQQPGITPTGIPGQPQMSPQLLALLAQLHGAGLGGFQQTQQGGFGRFGGGVGLQPIQTGAYSLR